MRKKSLLTMAASLALVAAVGVGSTLAYFTDNTETVTNTFTVGSGYAEGALKLEELEAERPVGGGAYAHTTVWTPVGEDYSNILPGETIPKNPTVKLAKGSVKSYVFVVVKGVDAALKDLGNATESAGLNNWLKDEDGTATKLKDLNSWDVTADIKDGVYYFIVDETTAPEEGSDEAPYWEYTMFDEIKVQPDASLVEINPETNEEQPITVEKMQFKAGAIQFETFTQTTENGEIKSAVRNAYEAFTNACEDFETNFPVIRN